MNQTDNILSEQLEPNDSYVDNHRPLAAMAQLTAVLSPDEEHAFMQIMFSSSATVRNDNFGLPRREVMRLLQLKPEEIDAFHQFIDRVNQSVARYFQLVYDERRDQTILLMRVPARQAKDMLSAESLALLMFIFYHQDVLQNEFTLFTQLLEAFGHETLDIRRKMQVNLSALMRIGAITKFESVSEEEAYELTAIGSRMFGNSYLKRFAEFSQSQQLHMDEVLKFFKRYNLGGADTL
ncbi:hypothetical protein M3650_21930 [Paenibacillus sp. MER TA 81-3]|uniref:hypothetical protein n=1 Tax=Paenibacillus sp. MER TA 81-3 TaxID=2939573 RepID=UPI00203FF572|nr:hypothetical protein [Paenibacillus sp. MER TA 81-3]MCM3341217.1 hypothetical protein [Paenibacillus sp. MER TA 81-3]